MTDRDRLLLLPDPGAAEREAEFLDRVESIVPFVREKALEAEELRHLPESTLSVIEETGMFRLHAPLVYGGLQLGLNAHVQAARMLAQGDLSTAWVASFLTLGSYNVAKRRKEQQDLIFGENPSVRTCGTQHYSKGSTIIRDGDSYVINGRWGFASGVHNARYVGVTVPVEGPADRPESRLVPEEERPGRISALVPVDKVQIADVWYMSGMKATGSQDVVIDNLRLDPIYITDYRENVEMENPGSKLHPDFPMLRYSLHHVIWTTHAAYVLGAAERAVEYFRTEIAGRRSLPFGSGRLIESQIVQRNYAEARHIVDTSRVLFDHRIRTIVDIYERGQEPDWDLRAYLNIDTVGMIREAARAVQIVARMSGGSMHKSNNELDRIQRDIEVLQNHSSGDWDFHAQTSGRVQLGLGLGERPGEFF